MSYTETAGNGMKAPARPEQAETKPGRAKGSNKPQAKAKTLPTNQYQVTTISLVKGVDSYTGYIPRRLLGDKAKTMDYLEKVVAQKFDICPDFNFIVSVWWQEKINWAADESLINLCFYPVKREDICINGKPLQHTAFGDHVDIQGMPGSVYFIDVARFVLAAVTASGYQKPVVTVNGTKLSASQLHYLGTYGKELVEQVVSTCACRNVIGLFPTSVIYYEVRHHLLEKINLAKNSYQNLKAGDTGICAVCGGKHEITQKCSEEVAHHD